MYIFIIIIFSALIGYWIGKKRAIKTNSRELIKSILWFEACVFLIGYFITNAYDFKITWFTFMFFASIVTLIPRR